MYLLKFISGDDENVGLFRATLVVPVLRKTLDTDFSDFAVKRRTHPSSLKVKERVEIITVLFDIIYKFICKFIQSL